MEKSQAKPMLLINGIIALLLCAALVVICYYYVDRPVAFWVHDQHFRQYPLLKYFTFIPNYIAALVPIIYIGFIILYAFGIDRYFTRVMLAIANSVVIAIFLKTVSKIMFGRYWAETWIGKNPSLIKNKAYGFHFFRMGNSYGSFPSGHTTVIMAAMTVLWIAYPKLRLLYVLLVAIVIVGLVGKNDHFVGDTLGGLFLGGLTAYYTVKISEIKHRPLSS
ncbi:MAG: phosphatase PAP2 family protein [Gammaproteobacteria bacterium]